MIEGLFDLDFRMNKIDKNGDPLVQLASLINWEFFRAPIEKMRRGSQPRNFKAGRNPLDAVLMIKIVVLQSLYNLSDAQTERQILDRLSFMRFLGLAIGDDVPDEKTIWLFKEQLAEAKLTEKLFERFDSFLRDNGFQVRKGPSIDANIVSVPKQRNTRKENKRIKARVSGTHSAQRRSQSSVE